MKEFTSPVTSSTQPHLKLVGADPGPDPGTSASSARRFAGNPVKDSPEAQALVSELKLRLRDERQNGFAIGDLAGQLIGNFGYGVADLAAQLDYSRTRLHEIYLTAQTFGPDQRDDAVCFSYYEVARKAAAKFRIPAAECLQTVKALGKGSVRQVSRALSQKYIDRENQKARENAPFIVARNATLVDKCHHAPFQDILAQHPTVKFDCVWADPPYVYDSAYGGCGVAREQCENIKPEDAIRVTSDALRLCADRMNPGAAFLLCAAAGGLPLEVLTAVRQFGWQIQIELHWDKVKTAPGDNFGPYLPRTESIWVLKRPGDRLLACDGQIHSNILTGFAPVLHRATAAGSTHMFQKPEDLLEFFLRKHTRPGQLIADLFGCSGSMCIAADRLQRHWIYIEANLDNFLWGSQRVLATIGANKSKAA